MIKVEDLCESCPYLETKVKDDLNDEDNDYVVKELDVYLCTPPNNSDLFILQYPIRPSNMDYVGPVHIGARYKSKFQMLELDLMVDTNSRNYSHEKGEQMAQNVDGNTKGADNRYYESGLVDKQTIVSSNVHNANDNNPLKTYAIGYVTENRLQIYPLRNIFHMRPSDTPLDRADDNLDANQIIENDNDDDRAEADDAQRVSVRFSQKNAFENDILEQRRKQSYSYYLTERSEEPWNHMAYLTETESIDVLLKFNDLDSYQNSDFIDDLDDNENNILNGIVLSKPGNLSLMHSNLGAILRRCQLLCFSEYVSFTNFYPDKVIIDIQLLASHIRNDIWCLKSDLRFKEDYRSNQGATRDRMSNCRDLILLCFRKFGSLDIGKIKQATRLHFDDIHEALRGIGQRVNSRTRSIWIPTINSAVNDFRSKYPAIVDRQSALWDKRSKLLQEQLMLIDFSQFRHEYVDTLCAENLPAFKSVYDNSTSSVITKYFTVRFWFKLSELRMRISTESIKGSINSYCSDSELISTAENLGFVHVSKMWPTANSNEPILLNFNVNDNKECDLIRRAMCTLLLDRYCFTYRQLKDTIVKLAIEISTNTPTDVQIRNFVKEECDSKTMNQRVWYVLKNSVIFQ
ncbi:hypothetical protein GJ496_005172 [Pomphorhynchus laevis]|nr:hypothetical protein GJ496_005172 [Pomphorhynchus laevis]